MLPMLLPAISRLLRSPPNLEQQVKKLLANEQSIWLDPADLSTLYQDSAGTTPVTADNQPVGLMLDKSRSLALGPELITDGDNEAALFSTSPATIATNGTIARSTDLGGTACKFTGTGTTGAAYIKPFGANGMTAGKSYKITLRLYIPTAWVGSGIRLIDTNDASWSTAFYTTRDSWLTITAIRPAKAVAWTLGIGSNISEDHNGQSFYVDDLSVKELPGNHAYQNTATAKPVLKKNVNGRLFLEFDGIDDFLVTPAIDFSATDSVTACVGIRKLSDALAGVVLEFGTSFDTPGSFGIIAPPSNGSANVRYRQTGSILITTDATALAAPVSVVATGYGKISAPSASIRANGIWKSTNTNNQGTGNMGNLPLYIGRRAGVSSPFKGYFYGALIVGKLCTAQQMGIMEKYLNRKLRAY